MVSNAIVAGVLAAVAWVFQRSGRSAGIANLLWVIVLIKMVTPPLFSVPLIEFQGTVSPLQAGGGLVGSEPAVGVFPAIGSGAVAGPVDRLAMSGRFSWGLVTVLAWALLSAVFLVVSTGRIWRFSRLLKRHSRPAPEVVLALGEELSVQMGLSRPPLIVFTDARLAPLVWWTGGRPRIILSESALRVGDDDALRMVLAHEMAHLKRCDHWVRWVEFVAGVTAWWNPLQWWVRRHLRITEEVACDELVIEKTRPDRRDYAATLLNMAEWLTTRPVCPPALASGMNSGGQLEHRLKKIMTTKTLQTPVWLRPAIVAVATCALPLGLVTAQNYEAIERRLGAGIEAGELTLDQARVMLDALKKSHGNGHDLEAKKRKYMEIEREIKAAVKAGKLSEEEAGKKLAGLREEMFGVGKSKGGGDREMEAKKRKYMEVEREIKAAVKAGKLSKEEAGKKLTGLREEMFGVGKSKGGGDREMEAKKRKYMEVEREIKAAVEAGKVSKEEAGKKLAGLRKEMFGVGKSKGGSDREMEAKKARYEAGERKIKAAVKAGKVSKEEAEKRLIEMRKAMSGDGKSERRK